jgi:hypothetical protein
LEAPERQQPVLAGIAKTNSRRTISNVILSTGGRLGIKSELSALPPQAFMFDPNKDMLTLDRTKESLENAPHFKAGDWRYGVDHPAI